MIAKFKNDNWVVKINAGNNRHFVIYESDMKGEICNKVCNILKTEKEASCIKCDIPCIVTDTKN